jgi:hypothetical protein
MKLHKSLDKEVVKFKGIQGKKNNNNNVKITLTEKFK